MPEDGLIGFKFFETQVGNRTINIANDAAVRAASDQLLNQTAAAARAGHLETASAAVEDAALRKALRNEDGPNDLEETFGEGSDFFL